MGNSSSKALPASSSMVGPSKHADTARSSRQLSVSIEVQCYVSDDEVDNTGLRDSLTAHSLCTTDSSAPRPSSSSSSNSFFTSNQAKQKRWKGAFKQLKRRNIPPSSATAASYSDDSNDCTPAAAVKLSTAAVRPLTPGKSIFTSKLHSGYSKSRDWASSTFQSLQHSSKRLLTPSCLTPPSCLEDQQEQQHDDGDDDSAAHDTLLDTPKQQQGQQENYSSSPNQLQLSPAEEEGPPKEKEQLASAPAPAAPQALPVCSEHDTLSTGVYSTAEKNSSDTALASNTDYHTTQDPDSTTIPTTTPQLSVWSYGCSSVQNARQHMEDRVVLRDLTGHPAFFPHASRAGVFAVCDGHGGHAAADYLASHVVSHILEEGPFDVLHSSHCQPLTALERAICKAESHLLRKWTPGDGPASGSTLCLGLLVDDKLHMAHVGDSRAVLARGAGAGSTRMTALTRDHKPTCSFEAARMNSVDPQASVSTDGYLYGELGVSRGLGSAHIKADPAKAAYVATPELVTVQLEATDDFIICATDGLWDKVGSADAINAARRSLAENRDPTAASQMLVERAQKLGSLDNISVITVLLHGRDIVLPKSNSRLFSRRAVQPAADTAADGSSASESASTPAAVAEMAAPVVI